MIAMDIQQRAAKLTTWLVSYGTYLELICIGIRAGNHAVCGCSSLPELHRQYQSLFPHSSQDVIELAVWHRAVIESLCRFREQRQDTNAEERFERQLATCRQAHDEVLRRMLGRLAPLSGWHMEHT